MVLHMYNDFTHTILRKLSIDVWESGIWGYALAMHDEDPALGKLFPNNGPGKRGVEFYTAWKVVYIDSSRMSTSDYPS